MGPHHPDIRCSLGELVVFLVSLCCRLSLPTKIPLASLCRIGLEPRAAVVPPSTPLSLSPPLLSAIHDVT